MKISIVIPAFNEEKLIGATLQSIHLSTKAFHQRAWETEIIVCDNNSTDGTAEIARNAGAKVVFEPINQIGRARNCGAAAATGEWLVFVDADSSPSAGLFSDVVKAIESGNVLAGGSTVRMDTASLSIRFWAGIWNTISRVMRWAAGSFIYCETAAFRAVGGFDHQFFTGEELDLSRKLNRLARRQKKRVLILHRHPLLTSDRKVHLYRQGELLRFFIRAVLRPSATMKNRAACSPWYDGRR